MGLLARVGWNVREFFGLAGDATFLCPRWVVLRAVGLVYVFIFAGIVVEGRALLGPLGIMPATEYLAELTKLFPALLVAFCKAPSVFWLGGSAGLIGATAWLGLVAAVALVLNLWPRMALFVCWLSFLSFVTTWGEFSPAQLDRLMLEVAVLCIPFAPRGVRPRLGADSPPLPIALFMMRWLLFRVMVESGVVKLLSADPHWRNLTAMDVMYETSPSPTLAGYWAHHLPHAYHVFEIAFTFAAELIAPALAMLGGRRGRWVALLLWSLLQFGIQLTCNFGWLNAAAFGLGLLLLDDQMLGAAAEKLKLRRGRACLAARPALPAPRPTAPWRRRLVHGALLGHFCLTLFYFAMAFGVPLENAPAAIAGPERFFAEFRSANGYYLYANFEQAHYQIDFEGSNDGGKTWRTYAYRHVPQREERAPPFVAPWFPRFETAVQLESSRPGKRTIVPLAAAHLLARTPDVPALFAGDPFPDRPPTVVRMRRYRLAFTDPETRRRTGRYWRKEQAGDYLPALYITAEGKIAQFSLEEPDAAAAAGNYAAAVREYERQYQLGHLDAGYRLADLHARGAGGPERPDKAFALFADLAERGEVKALHNLGLCYEHGITVPADPNRAAACYLRAAEGGNLLSMLAYGQLAARDVLVPRDDVGGLSWLLEAAERATGQEPGDVFVREKQPPEAKRLMERMTASDLAAARARAAARR